MKSVKIPHHPGGNADVWSDVGTELDKRAVGPTPAASTDNAMARWDGTGGRTLQDSPIIAADNGDVSGVNVLTAATLSPTNPLAINKGGTANTTATAAFDALAPTTTTGDIIVHNGTDNVRLAIGSTGQVPTVTGGTLAYATPTSGGVVLLTSGTSAAVATLDIVLTAYTAYRGLWFVISDALPVTDGDDLWVRFSTDGGANYDASGYNYMLLQLFDGGTNSQLASGSGNFIQIGNGIGNGSTEGYCGDVKLLNQTSTARWCRLYQNSFWINSAGTPAGTFSSGGGSREAAQDTDAIRFMFSTGNISTITYAVYGLT